jgi:SAM-dependent methyltransferase
MTAIHHAAAAGYASAADRYAQGRPEYPEALDRWLVEVVGLGPASRVIDLGAGTGKFLPRLSSTGARVTAVEPVAAMRSTLCARFPDAVVVDGTAESLPFDDASFDAVVCAQSFHWFATARAVAEIARVLKPGGTLALVWNVRDESVPWVARMTAILAPYVGDAPRHQSGAWKQPFPAPAFEPLACARFPHAHAGTVDDVLIARVMSVSFVAALPAAERATIEGELRRLVADEPTLAGRDTIVFPYVTEAYHARRVA